MIPDFNLSEEDLVDSREENIGKCVKCQYFDVERERETPTEETLAPCLHPDMEEFELLVSGDSGCNLYEMADELADEDDEDGEEEDSDDNQDDLS